MKKNQQEEYISHDYIKTLGLNIIQFYIFKVKSDHTLKL